MQRHKARTPTHMPQHKARKLSPAIQRAVERREVIERDFTPIEKHFVQSADLLSQISRQIEDTEPEDTVLVIGLELATAKRSGPANGAGAYTGI